MTGTFDYSKSCAVSSLREAITHHVNSITLPRAVASVQCSAQYNSAYLHSVKAYKALSSYNVTALDGMLQCYCHDMINICEQQH
eukprot:1004-Heterococcus_DN1.PRE.2